MYKKIYSWKRNFESHNAPSPCQFLLERASLLQTPLFTSQPPLVVTSLLAKAHYRLCMFRMYRERRRSHSHKNEWNRVDEWPRKCNDGHVSAVSLCLSSFPWRLSFHRTPEHSFHSIGLHKCQRKPCCCMSCMLEACVRHRLSSWCVWANMPANPSQSQERKNAKWWNLARHYINYCKSGLLCLDYLIFREQSSLLGPSWSRATEIYAVDLRNVGNDDKSNKAEPTLSKAHALSRRI